MDRGNQIASSPIDFVPHPPSRLHAYASMEENIEISFGRFNYRFEKEGAYRHETPVPRKQLVAESDLSDSANSSPRRGNTMTEQIVEIQEDIVESPKDTTDINGCSPVNSSGEVLADLYDGVTKPSADSAAKYH